ncbi:DUF3300 domain-containing protein [Paraburkholderia sp. RL18-103-BIB-C]|jgi:hypothetical protein|uniref:DUF3300 domain-containing protein n=1 Tax=unclassified Paraburkholderia TaxID=2615204 RepID=UPI0038B8A066
MKLMRRVLTIVVPSCIAFGMAGHAFADQDSQTLVPPSVAIQRTPEELQQLVAPIALYPDPLVAQILAAATHIAEVVAADRWMQSNSQLTGDALAAQVDQQVWDASVKALTGFPAVLANMDQNVVWTSSLGDAYLSQTQQLMAAIQTMRQQASTAGNLEINQQETVTNDGGLISILPADPAVVYVPEYDPSLVYGAPMALWPGWYRDPDLYLDGPGIVFGVGFDLGYFGGYGWGWRHWRPDWHHRAVWFDGGQYVWHNRSLIDANHFFHGNDGFNSPHGAYDMRGMYGAARTHLPAMSPRQFVGSHRVPGVGLSRFGGIGPEGFGRAEFGSGRPGFGSTGRAEIGHMSAGARGGSGRG